MSDMTVPVQPPSSSPNTQATGDSNSDASSTSGVAAATIASGAISGNALLKLAAESMSSLADSTEGVNRQSARIVADSLTTDNTSQAASAEQVNAGELPVPRVTIFANGSNSFMEPSAAAKLASILLTVAGLEKEISQQSYAAIQNQMTFTIQNAAAQIGIISEQEGADIQKANAAILAASMSIVGSVVSMAMHVKATKDLRNDLADADSKESTEVARRPGAPTPTDTRPATPAQEARDNQERQETDADLEGHRATLTIQSEERVARKKGQEDQAQTAGTAPSTTPAPAIRREQTGQDTTEELSVSSATPEEVTLEIEGGTLTPQRTAITKGGEGTDRDEITGYTAGEDSNGKFHEATGTGIQTPVSAPVDEAPPTTNNPAATANNSDSNRVAMANANYTTHKAFADGFGNLMTQSGVIASKVQEEQAIHLKADADTKKVLVDSFQKLVDMVTNGLTGDISQIDQNFKAILQTAHDLMRQETDNQKALMQSR